MLTRAQIEAAAWAAYAHEELVKAADTASWVKLRSFVPKTLFGTAIAKEAKHLPGEAQDPLWLEVSSVMNAIDASTASSMLLGATIPELFAFFTRCYRTTLILLSVASGTSSNLSLIHSMRGQSGTHVTSAPRPARLI